MKIYCMSLLISILLVLLVYLAGSSLYKKSNSSLTQASPFECGINNVSQLAKPVSLRFFMLSVVFLIFDVELLIIYPILLEWFKNMNFTSLLSLLLFLIIITWGLLWEWSQKMLDWSK